MTTSVEVWKPVVGYEGLYEVSNQGGVRNLQTTRILSTKPSKHLGYVLCNLRRQGVVQGCYAHSLVLEAFVGLRPSSNHQACHGNGNRADNRLHREIALDYGVSRSRVTTIKNRKDWAWLP